MKSLEQQARELLESKGFTKFQLLNRPEAILGLRWYCRIQNVDALVPGGQARGWGFTAKGAVLEALLCHPLLRTKDETESD